MPESPTSDVWEDAGLQNSITPPDPADVLEDIDPAMSGEFGQRLREQSDRDPFVSHLSQGEEHQAMWDKASFNYPVSHEATLDLVDPITDPLDTSVFLRTGYYDNQPPPMPPMSQMTSGDFYNQYPPQSHGPPPMPRAVYGAAGGDPGYMDFEYLRELHHPVLGSSQAPPLFNGSSAMDLGGMYDLRLPVAPHVLQSGHPANPHLTKAAYTGANGDKSDLANQAESNPNKQSHWTSSGWPHGTENVDIDTYFSLDKDLASDFNDPHLNFPPSRSHPSNISTGTLGFSQDYAPGPHHNHSYNTVPPSHPEWVAPRPPEGTCTTEEEAASFNKPEKYSLSTDLSQIMVRTSPPPPLGVQVPSIPSTSRVQPSPSPLQPLRAGQPPQPSLSPQNSHSSPSSQSLPPAPVAVSDAKAAAASARPNRRGDRHHPDPSLLKVEHAKEDKRKFKLCMLPNGMEVLIVNEPLNKGTVALSVAAGSKDDPPEFPGLAQFVQRMVTCGSKRFPGAKMHREYFQSKNESSAGALTTSDMTVHTIQVVNQFMRAGIERLMRSVTEPLFPPEAMFDELNAMDLLFVRSVENREFQYKQLEKTLLGSECNVTPYGSRLTLLQAHSRSSDPRLASELTKNSALSSFVDTEENIERRLINLKCSAEDYTKLLAAASSFYQKHYIPSRMKLLIYASQRIDLVEKWIEFLFANLNDPTEGRTMLPSSIKIPDFAFASPKFSHRYPYCGTLAQMRVDESGPPRLIISFPVQDQRLLYRENPCAYFGYILSIDEPTSFLGRARSAGLLNGIECRYEHKMEGLDLFKIDMTLTKKGDVLYDRVAGLLFVYLEDLTKKEPLEDLYTRMVGEMTESFNRRKISVFDEAVSTAEIMQLPVPRERIVNFHIPCDFSPQMIKLVAQYLRFENSLIAHLSPQHMRWQHMEPLMGLKYSAMQMRFERTNNVGKIVKL